MRMAAAVESGSCWKNEKHGSQRRRGEMDTKQSQASLSEQLKTLGRLAIDAGLYDADDYLVEIKREVSALTTALAAERERVGAAETRVNVLCVAVSQLESQLAAALARAEKAEARCVTLRELADNSAAEQGEYARKMMEAQSQRDAALASLAAAEAERDRLRELITERLPENARALPLEDINDYYDDWYGRARAALASRKEHGNG
jgi:chromosome segregation ATPase